MTNNKDIKLNYFKTFRVDTQWFLLYEFVNIDKNLLCKTDQEIITSLITTKILNEKIYHSEMDDSEIEIHREALQEIINRPYTFENLELTDFQLISNRQGFNDWLIKFRMEDWEEDKEDAQVLIDQAESEIFNRTKLLNGIWWLSKTKFEDGDKKLADLHWIYNHFETFIEIDREQELIRTIDFGYD